MTTDQLDTTFAALADPTRRAILARLAGFSKKTLRDLRRRVDVHDDPAGHQIVTFTALAALHDVKVRVQDGILNTPTSLEKEGRELIPAEAVAWFPAVAVAAAAVLCTIAQAITKAMAEWPAPGNSDAGNRQSPERE